MATRALGPAAIHNQMCVCVRARALTYKCNGLRVNWGYSLNPRHSSVVRLFFIFSRPRWALSSAQTKKTKKTRTRTRTTTKSLKTTLDY
eukprot:2907233-Pyramimonas_sp.AAC.2